VLIRRYFPEFLFAVLMSCLLLVGYSFRDSYNPMPLRTPRPVERVQPLYLLQLEHPGGQLSISLEGEIQGGPQSKVMTYTELNDFRAAVGKLKPAASGQSGRWKLRFCDDKGPHQLNFELKEAAPEVEHLLQHLRLLGALKS
jgi:hypothetical protein